MDSSLLFLVGFIFIAGALGLVTHWSRRRANRVRDATSRAEMSELVNVGSAHDRSTMDKVTVDRGTSSRLSVVEVARRLNEAWDEQDFEGGDEFEIPAFLRRSPDGATRVRNDLDRVTDSASKTPAFRRRDRDTDEDATKHPVQPDRLARDVATSTRELSLATPSVWRARDRAPATQEASKQEWGFHITDDFRKAVKDLDKSMRGRVLDAITEICQRPMEVRGDTVKPLSGEYAGCWRYRMGDYRLVYFPVRDARRIDLITIGGRGSVYLH